MKEYAVQKVQISNGEELAYRSTGNGDKTFLLVHGNMSSSVHWQILMEKLEESYRVVAVDLRGFGDSSYKNRFNSLRELAEDLEDFMVQLDLKKCTVVGWSTGGGVIMELADLVEAKKRIENIVLLDSVGPRGFVINKKDENGIPIEDVFLTTKDEIAKDPIQVAPIIVAYENQDREFIKTLWNTVIYNLNQPSSKEYDKYVDAILKQRNLIDIDYSLVHFNASEEDTVAQEGSGLVKRIDVPVTIVHGEHDLVVPLEEAKLMHQLIPDSQLKIIKNAGHSILTDQLDELSKILHSFGK